MEKLISPTEFAKKRKHSRNALEIFNEDKFKGSPVKKNLLKIRTMYIAAFTALLLALSLGLATGYSAPATYDMEFNQISIVKPNINEITWIGSILALGLMAGGFLAGPLADKLGRKDALVLNLLPFAAGWLIIVYATTVSTIIIGRFICGLAAGVITVIVPMYCVEISTTESRGILGSGFQGFLVIGNFISVLVGSYITWKYLALHGAVVIFLATLCFLPMPESPRWFLAKGNLKSAISVMHTLQGDFVDAEKECTIIYDDLKNQPKGRISWKELKHPTVYKPTFIAFTLFFFCQSSGANAVFFYSSHIFEIAKDFLDPKTSTVVLGGVQVIATLVSNLIVDKTGRKILLILSGSFMAFNLIVLGIYYYMSSTDSTFQTKFSWIPLVTLIIFVIAYSIGYGPLPHLLTAEMIPTRARSTVSGLISLANGLFGFILLKTFGELQILLNDYGTFWLYSGFSVLGVIFVIFVVPETKGKNLEDIQQLFHRPMQNVQSLGISVISS